MDSNCSYHSVDRNTNGVSPGGYRVVERGSRGKYLKEEVGKEHRQDDSEAIHTAKREVAEEKENAYIEMYVELNTK